MRGGRHVQGAAALVGLAGAGVLVWAVLSSIDGYPRYSPLRHFISQLADPINPHAGRVNYAFVAGGVLVALAMAVRSVSLVGTASVWAARLAAAAGACLCFVGVFDLTAPVPHFGFAILTGAFSLAACVLFAGATRRMSTDPTQSPSTRGGAAAVRLLVWLQVASLASGVAYAVVVIVRVSPDSLEQLLRLPTRLVWIRVGDTFINPFSFAEWVLFGVVTLLLVVSCAHRLLETYAR